LHGREQLFQRLVETVHYAVLVTANGSVRHSRFLALWDWTAPDVVGRHFERLRRPSMSSWW